MTDLHWLTADEASRAFAKRSLSPVELLRALLARIEKLDPQLNVFIRLDAEAALKAARDAEREIAAGRARGPLHGIPVGVKDIFDVEGLPTTCHSKILLDNLAQQDADAVARLRNAGAIVLGKVATHEFAIGGPSFDLPFPPARNPWDRTRHPGGSSSGSGAGLAAGFFPLAIGSDTGGSIRNPAGACGIVGLKPTYGRVSARGVFPLAYTLDHVGPMARSVADAAAMFAVLSGERAALSPSLKGLRVGVVRHFHETDMPAAPEIAAAVAETERTLAKEGAALRTVTLPDLKQFAAVNRIILQSEAWSVHAPWLRTRPGDYGQSGRRRLLAGAFLSAGDYVDAQRRRRRMIAATQEAFGQVDVLLTANAMDVPCRIDDADAVARTYQRQARTPFNVTGHPAVALMAGLSKEGLPLSIQLVGRYGEEAALLDAAAGFERATEWHTRHPVLS